MNPLAVDRPGQRQPTGQKDSFGVGSDLRNRREISNMRHRGLDSWKSIVCGYARWNSHRKSPSTGDEMEYFLYIFAEIFSGSVELVSTELG